uniref:CHK kinase-like domain-containing protein n=1 Tax=Bactrocera latifrons TaxID=174628 RepID=A0A0K8VNJ1_BACLA
MVNAGSESHGEDASNTPEWINEEFFKRILDKDESDNVKINKLLLSSGSSKIDNYASVLYRAKIKYALCSQPNQEKIRSFVMKTEHFEEGLQKDKLGEMAIFETEVRMYTIVLPMIKAKLREFGDQTVLAPKIFHSSLEMPRNIVFEDLVTEGYSIISERPGSLEEIKLALKKLAKIHAISYQMAQMGNKDITTFNKTYVNTLNLDDFVVLRDGVKLMKKVISDQPDLQKYLPHFESVEKFLFPKVLDLLNAAKNGKRSGVQVLNHGDFHMKNLMVKYVDNELKELMLLDYQTCFFGSPAIDLHYAFAMMYSPSMRLDKMDELLYYYTKNFQDTLHTVQYKGHIPTITEIREEVCT